MAQYSFLSTRFKEEVEYYWFRAEIEFGDHYIGKQRLESHSLSRQLEQLNRLLLEKLGHRHAVILGTKWRLDYETETGFDDDVFEWIDTPRVSGFCFMMIDFSKRDFTKLPPSPRPGSLSELKPESLQQASSNQRHIFNNDRDDTKRFTHYKIPANSFASKLAKEKKKSEITNTIPYNKPSPVDIPVNSNADTHKKRLTQIVDYLTNYLDYTHGNQNNDIFHLITNLKYSWQNVFLYNNNLDWIDNENEEQAKWLLEEIKKEYDEKFFLPWISSSTTKLTQSLITYMDIQWHYNHESTIETCGKFKKAWIRKQKSKEKSNGLVSLTAKTNSQLLDLESKLQKSRKHIIKSLVENKYNEECT